MSNVTQQDLKLAIQDLHKSAETTQLAQDLISGNIDPHIYRNLCYQMWLITDAIESQLKLNLDICRRHQFVQDIAECPAGPVAACPSTIKYVDYIKDMYFTHGSGQLKGAIYCFYLGWLYGGQMIAKKLNLPKHHLEFDNVKECVDYVRNIQLGYLIDRDVEEARKAFEYTIKIYQELYELY